MAPEDKGGMSGYVAPVARKRKKGKGKAKGKAKAKPSISRSNPYDVKRPAQNPEIRTNNPAAGRVSRRSADAYGSPAKARKGALGGLSPVLRAVTEAARDVASNIQNKAGDKAKMSMAQAYKAAAKPKGGSGGGRASSQRGKKK
jgi:hypothetical protein